nr:transposase [Candidatus Accumulibacter phosphatis]
MHTHSRRLDFHPHVHLVVPAAAVDAAKQRWRRKRRGKNGVYLFNFGFLHANCKRLIGLLHLLLKFDPSRFTPPRKARPAMLCACCGAVTVIVRTRIRSTSSSVVAMPPVVAVAL